jgi:uncharacterized protein (TIGR03066 family)
MRPVGVLVLLCAPLLLTGCGKKSNADLIVGKWEVTKGERVPVGSVAEFTKDGKMKVNRKAVDRTKSMEGTYKVEGDKITTTVEGETETDTINTLNDTTLIMEDSKGKTIEMKKK